LKFIVYRAITAINDANEVVVERVHKDVRFSAASKAVWSVVAGTIDSF
jgi:hypothetical protein